MSKPTKPRPLVNRRAARAQCLEALRKWGKPRRAVPRGFYKELDTHCASAIARLALSFDQPPAHNHKPKS